METDFPALEVKQLDEEPVRRKTMDGGGGGDRVYQGWRWLDSDKLAAIHPSDPASKGVF